MFSTFIYKYDNWREYLFFGVGVGHTAGTKSTPYQTPRYLIRHWVCNSEKECPAYHSFAIQLFSVKSRGVSGSI